VLSGKRGELNKKKITFCNYTKENTQHGMVCCHPCEEKDIFPHEKQATKGPCLFGQAKQNTELK